MNKRLTIDTIALRDVCRMDLLHPLAKLGYTLQTTTLTYTKLNGEVRDEIDLAIATGILHIQHLTSHESGLVLKIQAQNPGLTLADAAILYQSERDGCYLYTVDSTIRKIAGYMDITVLDHSMLLARMVEKDILNLTLATEKYYEIIRWINKFCDTAPPVNNFPSIDSIEEAC